MKVVNRTLTLTNDGALWVYFLGCGSAFSKRHYQTNILIVKGDDHLLVDCGTTCSRALADAGLSVLDIDNVLITHSHADHIGGLEELLLMNRYVARKKPRVFIPKTYQTQLWRQSLRGGAEMNERRDGRGLSFEDYVEVARPRRIKGATREMSRFSVGGIEIRTFRTRHYPDQADSWSDAMYSIGLIVDECVFISGDTQFDRDLFVEVAPIGSVAAYFHDAQLFTGGIHASLTELAKTDPAIKSRMHLMHYGDNYSDFEATVSEQGFAGFTQQARIYQL